MCLVLGKKLIYFLEIHEIIYLKTNIITHSFTFVLCFRSATYKLDTTSEFLNLAC